MRLRRKPRAVSRTRARCRRRASSSRPWPWRRVVVTLRRVGVDLGKVVGELVVCIRLRLRVAGVVAPALQPPFELDRARRAGVKARRGRRQRRSTACRLPQRIGERIERLLDRRLLGRAPTSAAHRQLVHRRAQQAHALLERARGILHRRQRRGHLLALGQRIAGQLHQRPRAQRLAKELRGQLRQLVGLVDDERLRARQDLAEAFLLERQVGQQQVVVDHHQVRRLRTLARLHDEAVGEERALAAQAVFRGAGDHRQQRRVFPAARVQLSARSPMRVRPDQATMRWNCAASLARGEARLALRLAHAVVAQVVGAALQQRGLQSRCRGRRARAAGRDGRAGPAARACRWRRWSSCPTATPERGRQRSCRCRCLLRPAACRGCRPHRRCAAAPGPAGRRVCEGRDVAREFAAVGQGRTARLAEAIAHALAVPAGPVRLRLGQVHVRSDEGASGWRLCRGTGHSHKSVRPHPALSLAFQ